MDLLACRAVARRAGAQARAGERVVRLREAARGQRCSPRFGATAFACRLACQPAFATLRIETPPRVAPVSAFAATRPARVRTRATTATTRYAARVGSVGVARVLAHRILTAPRLRQPGSPRGHPRSASPSRSCCCLPRPFVAEIHDVVFPARVASRPRSPPPTCPALASGGLAANHTAALAGSNSVSFRLATIRNPLKMA